MKSKEIPPHAIDKSYDDKFKGFMWPVNSDNTLFASHVASEMLQGALNDRSQAVIVRVFNSQGIEEYVFRNVGSGIVLSHKQPASKEDDIVQGRLSTIYTVAQIKASLSNDMGLRLQAFDPTNDEVFFEYQSEIGTDTHVIIGDVVRKKEHKHSLLGGLELNGVVDKNKNDIEVIQALINDSKRDLDKGRVRESYYQKWYETPGYLAYKQIYPNSVESTEEEVDRITTITPIIVANEKGSFFFRKNR